MPSALIIDDIADNRMLFREILNRAGYSVSDAADGRMGLEQLAQDQFDLLILDLQMPGMSGETILRHLKSNKTHPNMKIVVITANAHMETKTIAELADYVMFKPFDVRQLIELAKRLAPNAQIGS